jgi:2'-5' RNA ligase
MADGIRSFIAIALPQSIRHQIAEFQGELKQWNADIRWVRAESLHLTLKFLGSARPDLIEPVSRILSEITADIKPFNLTIQNVGCFPNQKNPRVIWIGIGKHSSLELIAEALNVQLEALGFSREQRPFKPHLSIGRVRSLKRIQPVLTRLFSHGFAVQSFSVDSVLLMKSDLKPEGAEYTVLHKILLQRTE